MKAPMTNLQKTKASVFEAFGRKISYQGVSVFKSYTSTGQLESAKGR